jgi:hypothetical protein
MSASSEGNGIQLGPTWPTMPHFMLDFWVLDFPTNLGPGPAFRGSTSKPTRPTVRQSETILAASEPTIKFPGRPVDAGQQPADRRGGSNSVFGVLGRVRF